MRFVVAFLPALACAGLMYGCIRMMLPHRKADMPDTGDAELRLRVAELEQRVEHLQLEGRSSAAEQEIRGGAQEEFRSADRAPEATVP